MHDYTLEVRTLPRPGMDKLIYTVPNTRFSNPVQAGEEIHLRNGEDEPADYVLGKVRKVVQVPGAHDSAESVLVIDYVGSEKGDRHLEHLLSKNFGHFTDHTKLNLSAQQR